MSRANSAPAFWRCGECGTPNPNAGYVVNCLGCGALKPTEAKTTITSVKVQPQKPSKTSAPTQASDVPRWRLWLGRLLLIAAWLYAAAVVGQFVLIAVLGERWWPTTFILFSPRWLMLLPLVPLVPLTFVARRRAVAWPLLGGALLVLGPWMGLCFPWQALTQTHEPGRISVRFATCNIEGGLATGLSEFVASLNPHIVVMQECPPEGPWATTYFRQPGWNLHYERGLGIATRLPIVAVEYRALAVPAWAGGHLVRFTLETPTGRINVFAVHLDTPRKGLEAVIGDKLAGVPTLEAGMASRWKEADDAAQWASESGLPYIIAGDFNMPADSPIYRRSFSKFLNAFAASGIGYGHSKFTRFFGIRIDHILGGPGWIARRCRVGPNVGSDHRPVIADLEWSP